MTTTKNANVPMIAYDSNYAVAIQHAFQRIIKLLEFIKTFAVNEARY
jgi:hypothetical protein